MCGDLWKGHAGSGYPATWPTSPVGNSGYPSRRVKLEMAKRGWNFFSLQSTALPGYQNHYSLGIFTINPSIRVPLSGSRIAWASQIAGFGYASRATIKLCFTQRWKTAFARGQAGLQIPGQARPEWDWPGLCRPGFGEACRLHGCLAAPVGFQYIPCNQSIFC